MVEIKEHCENKERKKRAKEEEVNATKKRLNGGTKVVDLFINL